MGSLGLGAGYSPRSITVPLYPFVIMIVLYLNKDPIYDCYRAGGCIQPRGFIGGLKGVGLGFWVLGLGFRVHD